MAVSGHVARESSPRAVRTIGTITTTLPALTAAVLTVPPLLHLAFFLIVIALLSVLILLLLLLLLRDLVWIPILGSTRSSPTSSIFTAKLLLAVVHVTHLSLLKKR